MTPIAGTGRGRALGKSGERESASSARVAESGAPSRPQFPDQKRAEKADFAESFHAARSLQMCSVLQRTEARCCLLFVLVSI